MKSGPDELNYEAKLLSCFESMSLIGPAQIQFSHHLTDPFKYLSSWLDNKSLISFSVSCRQISEWTGRECEIRSASRLLQLVVQGNQQGVKCMLECNASLLLNAFGNATDYSGKTIQDLTAFQAALCAGDVEMCIMMKEYCEELERGQQSLKEQYDAIFPLGIVTHSQEQKKTSFDFSKIISSILSATEDEVQAALHKQYNDSIALHQDLKRFRKAFDRISWETKSYNPWSLYGAFQAYDGTCDAAISWPKRDLIWRQVVGYTQRHLAACYAQGFAQGLHKIVYKNEKLHRNFTTRFSDDSLYPLALPSYSGLGFDFAVCSEWWSEGRCGGMNKERALRFSNYILSKNIMLENLFCPLSKDPGTWCNVF